MDDLSGVLLLTGFIDLVVLVAGCLALIWWKARFDPSIAAILAAWSCFFWEYCNFVVLPMTPMRLVPQAVLIAVLEGVALVMAVLFFGRLLSLHNRK